MELSVLVDNNSKAGTCLLAEHGLSFFIEEGPIKLLFDCGSTDAFIKNASTMEINLAKATDIVLSHSHLDHVGGLLRLQSLYEKFRNAGIDFPSKNIIAHPDVFMPSESNILDSESSVKLPEEALQRFFNLILSRRPQQITEKLIYLGEIPTPKIIFGDYSPDESALVYKSRDGLVIISGCSHSGIDNIIKHAQDVTGVKRINTVIGGLYLINKEQEEINRLGEYLLSQKVERIFPCHCTDVEAKTILSKSVKIEEVATGAKYKWN